MIRQLIIIILLLPVWCDSCTRLQAQSLKGTFNTTATDSQTSSKRVEFSIRLGQGGFQDERSPIGQLGGGQLTLDIRPVNLPLAFSLSGEYYTNSPEATHNYEIADMTVINLLYVVDPCRWERLRFFAGGGLGKLKVPVVEGFNPPLFDRFQRDRVALGLTHAPGVHDEELAMHPVGDPRMAGCSFRLGNLVRVVNVDVVRSPAVDVK